MPPPRRALHRALAALAALVAVAAAFVAGLVLGAAGTSAPTLGTGGVLDQAADEIASSALRPVDRGALDAAAIQGMLDVAGDPWGSWQGPAPVVEGADYVGVGLWLRRGADGAVVVAQVAPRSPAAAARLQTGDVVRAIDDRSTRGLPPAGVAALLRGAPGTSVRVLVARDDSLLQVRVRRAAVPAAGVTTTTEPAGDGAVTRVVVPAFASGVGRQVRDAVARARASRSRGLLLDLRGNAGGRLDEAVETASAFLDRGPVVSYTRRDGARQQLDAIGTGDTRLPLVVLVDGGTASAAEVVAGALQDRGRAVVVGSRTFGKGSVQEPQALADGSALDLTVARWATPSGRDVEGVGLVPDIEVAPGLPSSVAVRRGVEVLSGLLADGRGGRG